MTTLTHQMIDAWADDPKGPVALHLKQKLVPVEGDGAVIFPPTYADIGYNIDQLSDGTKVVTIDSVGSQANRMEPIFKRDDLKHLVPQITITLYKEMDGDNERHENTTIFDLSHRAADAVAQSSKELGPLVARAFRALKNRNDAFEMCCLAPTSLIFGSWDSRGGTGEKRPRLVRSVIRAYESEGLFSAAQFNSVWKSLSADQKAELEKEAKAKRKKLSVVGFADAPATFRKVSPNAAKQMPEFRDGEPNPQRRVLGGVISRNTERDVTVNLVALRRLEGSDAARTKAIRRYILGLSLIAACDDQDLFLRSGCQLQVPSATDEWFAVPRRGAPEATSLGGKDSWNVLIGYVEKNVTTFQACWPQQLNYDFDMKLAKALLAAAVEDEQADAE